MVKGSGLQKYILHDRGAQRLIFNFSGWIMIRSIQREKYQERVGFRGSRVRRRLRSLFNFHPRIGDKIDATCAGPLPCLGDAEGVQPAIGPRGSRPNAEYSTWGCRSCGCPRRNDLSGRNAGSRKGEAYWSAAIQSYTTCHSTAPSCPVS